MSANADWQDPKKGRIEGAVDSALNRVAPIRTHERVVAEFKGSFLGIDVGLTFSQLDLARKGRKGMEVIQVVNKDGSSNLETVLGRFHLSHQQRIELQGPAINTSATPGELPIGARLIGVGLTSDKTSAMEHDALSYTLEVKLTERALLELATLGGPGAASIAADAATRAVGSSLGTLLTSSLLGAVPILSTALAAQSARRAFVVVRDRTAPRAMKVFAVAHAIADATRILLPITGTLANATLVGIAAAKGWAHRRHADHAPPPGPPARRSAPKSADVDDFPSPSPAAASVRKDPS